MTTASLTVSVGHAPEKKSWSIRRLTCLMGSGTQTSF